MYKNSKTKINTRKDSEDWPTAYLIYKYRKCVTGQQPGVCPYPNKPQQTGSTHREEEVSFWTSLVLMHKNMYIRVRISCGRLVTDVQSLQASPVLGKQFVLLGMSDLSLASVGLLGIFSKASNA